jgi:hypothetical protein
VREQIRVSALITIGIREVTDPGDHVERYPGEQGEGAEGREGVGKIK